MTITAGMIAKAAATALSNEKLRKGIGWGLVAVLSPVILLIAAAIMFGASKMTSSQAAARVTGLIFVVCLVLAAVIAGAGGLINWATGIPLV